MTRISQWSVLKTGAQRLSNILELDYDKGEKLGQQIVATYTALNCNEPISKMSVLAIREMASLLSNRSEVLYAGILIGVINSSDNKTMDIN